MIDFMKYKFINLTFSAILIAISIVSFFVNGLNPSVDFVGGSLVEFSVNSEVYSKYNNDEINNQLKMIEGVDIINIQKTFTSSYVVRMKTIDEQKKNEVVAKLNEMYGQITLNKFDSVGPILGRELLFKTAIGVLIATIFIMVYVSWQFKDRIFGTSAIVAMIHDVIILFGAFSIIGKYWGVEVDTLFVTAVLTTLSFSVHDTIVVFDRIRERVSVKLNESLDVSINKAMAQTMPRSLNNSMTIIFMLTALFVLGGETIKWFSFALLVGTVCGTYSSPFVAVPLLSIFLKKLKRHK